MASSHDLEISSSGFAVALECGDEQVVARFEPVSGEAAAEVELAGASHTSPGEAASKRDCQRTFACVATLARLFDAAPVLANASLLALAHREGNHCRLVEFVGHGGAGLVLGRGARAGTARGRGKRDWCYRQVTDRSEGYCRAPPRVSELLDRVQGLYAVRPEPAFASTVLAMRRRTSLPPR